MALRTATMGKCWRKECKAEMVHPVDWWEAGPDHWEVVLRCGNCWHFKRDIYHESEVETFDVWLDDCQDQMKREADALKKVRMQEYADNFERMLELDIILPEDFLDA